MSNKFRSTLLSISAVSLTLLALASPTQATAQSVFQVNKHLYSESANPTADITSAMTIARREHKRIILDFGGNWCGDCLVLDFYYHQPPNSDLIAKHFVVVHIDIGHMDHNVDTAKKYHVPITKGVPALAVLDAHGNLLYSEHEKEFEHTSAEAVTAFLSHWKS